MVSQHAERIFFQGRTNISLLIPSDTTLLVNSGQKIYKNQIIGEVKKEANLLLEEDKKDIFTEVSGEAFFRNVEVTKNIDKQGSILNVSTKTGLIWVKLGSAVQVYTLKQWARLHPNPTSRKVNT